MTKDMGAQLYRQAFSDYFIADNAMCCYDVPLCFCSCLPPICMTRYEHYLYDLRFQIIYICQLRIIKPFPETLRISRIGSRGHLISDLIKID